MGAQIRLPRFSRRNLIATGGGMAVAAAVGSAATATPAAADPASINGYVELQLLNITDPHGYFDSRVAFPSSGQVRISWTYPPTDRALSSSLVTGYTEPLGATSSRTVQISIK